MRLDGALCYKAVVVAVTIKLKFDAHNLNILLILSAKLSIGAFFLFVYLEGLFPALDATNLLPEMHHFTQLYVILFFLTFWNIPVIKLHQGFKIIREEQEEAERELQLEEAMAKK